MFFQIIDIYTVLDHHLSALFFVFLSVHVTFTVVLFTFHFEYVVLW